jgi:hypothetical protein
VGFTVIMALSLYQTLCDLDAVPSLLESIRLRSPSGRWFLLAEELASKATHALEKFAVHYEEKGEGEPYKVPEEFSHLKLFDKHLELLMGAEDLNKLFMDNLADLEMVELLLPLVDPSANNNEAFYIASQSGYVAVVDRLLQDLRVDPSANHNEAVFIASHNGYVAVVDRLLQARDASGRLCDRPCMRVDPSAANNRALSSAVYYGHLAVVERLLADERVNPSAEDNHAIRWASSRGHLAIVKRLLADERVDPTACDNQAIKWASMNDRLDVVELLKARGCVLPA